MMDMLNQRNNDYKNLLKEAIAHGDDLYKQYAAIGNADSTLEPAMNAYSRALEQDSAAPYCLGRMARIELKRGNDKKAKQYAEKALTFDGRNRDACYTLGLLQLKRKNYKEGFDALNRALLFSGLDTSQVYHTIMQGHLDVCRDNTSLVKVLPHLAMALYYGTLMVASYPFDKECVGVKDFFALTGNLLAGHYFEESGQLDKALETYLKLYDRFPGAHNLGNIIGMIYRKKALPNEAFYWFEKALERHPNNEDALCQIAQIQEDKGNLEDAIRIYHKLMDWMPNDANLHCTLGNAYYMDNQLEQALSYYRSALKLGTDKKWCALLAQSMANIYNEHMQDSEAAKTAYQMAIELDPSEIENYVQLGLLYFRAEDYRNAQLIYESALSVDTRNPRLYSNLGYLRWMQEDLPEAIAFYDKAISQDPFYEIPYNNLGVIYLDTLGNVKRAIELLEKAISLNESYALAYYNLGRAYSFTDQRLEAAANFQKAQELNQFTRELDSDELEARINHLFS